MGFICVGGRFKGRDLDKKRLALPAALPRKRQRVLSQSPSPVVFKSLAHFLHLPPEIICYIFCLSGLNPSLPETCKAIHDMLLPNNLWLVDLAVKTNFAADIGVPNWDRQFETLAESLPERFHDAIKPRVDLARQIIDTCKAIDIRFFGLRFVDARIIEHVSASFGGIVVDGATLSESLVYKELFLKWQLLVLQKLVDLADTDKPVTELIAEAETACVALSTKNELHLHTPSTHSISIPPAWFRKMNPKQFEKVQALQSHYSMGIAAPLDLLLALFQANIFNEQAVAWLDDIDITTEEDAIALLQCLEVCRRLLQAYPLHERGQVPLNDIASRILHLVDTHLPSYHAQHPGEDHVLIREILEDLQLPELCVLFQNHVFL